MDAIRKELIRKIQTLGEVYTILSRATRLPYVICDPESFNDQVWIFESKEDLEKAVKPLTDKKNPVAAIKVENKSYLSFYTTLYTLGVNAVVFYEKDQEGTELDLEEIVKKPDFSSLPKEKQPLFNPQLQLSGIYFMQELRRGGANEEKQNLPELEEEVAAKAPPAKSQKLMGDAIKSGDDPPKPKTAPKPTRQLQREAPGTSHLQKRTRPQCVKLRKKMLKPKCLGSSNQKFRS